MSKQLKFDLCVIGAGSAGLSVVAGAQQMGASCVLIENGEMGGDCLNFGCVPSKALIAAAKKAYSQTSCAAFGIAPVVPDVNFERVHDHVRGVIDTIAPIDSQVRFEELGATVIRASAHFIAPNLVEADDIQIKARRFVVATGSSPLVPPIPGLEDVAYFTNETLFDQRQLPRHLVVLGGGPIGIEMAQAHRRLGAEVSVIEMNHILPKDDPDLTAVVRDQLAREGINLLEQTEAVSAVSQNEDVTVTVQSKGSTQTVTGSHLLVALGRRANVSDLDLEAGNIAYSPQGIEVDSRLRSTTNGRVFAIGDVAGQLQFTHVASYHAGIVVRNALFRVPAKSDLSPVPWVTYTDPEIAHVGLTERVARERFGDKIKILTWPLKENDRAQAERRTDGFIKVVVKTNGLILGASIVAPHAGEHIQMWALALAQKMKIGAMATYISPYPTYGEISKRVAGAFYTPTLFSRRTRMVVKFLSWFG